MAPRPTWRGYLKLSLVTCAVELSNATTHTDKVSFRILNRTTGNTVKRRYVDADTGKPLSDANEVKGYETDKDEFLLIEEEDLDAVQIESSHTLSLDTFVDKSSIEQIYLDTPYYVTPADDVSEEAFAVIRDALDKKKMAGLTRIVLYRRERPAVIEAFGPGMLLTTLRYGTTVRSADDVVGDLKSPEPEEEMIDIATAIIERSTKKFDPSGLEDRYENALLDLVKSKLAGHKPAKSRAPASKPSNVVNLFDALKKSLAGDTPEKDEEAKPKRAATKPTEKTKAASPARKRKGS